MLAKVKVPKVHDLKKTDKKTLKSWYKLLVLGRMIDERAPNYLKQALGWSYHAPYAGHDAQENSGLYNYPPEYQLIYSSEGVLCVPCRCHFMPYIPC